MAPLECLHGETNGGAQLGLQEGVQLNPSLFQNGPQSSFRDGPIAVTGDLRHHLRFGMTQDNVAPLAVVLLKAKALQSANNLSTR